MPPTTKLARSISLLAVTLAFLAGTAAGQALRINEPYYFGGGQGGDVLDFRGDRTGARVAFRAQTLDEARGVLFSIPADGGTAPVQLNGNLGGNAQVLGGYSFSLDDSRVLYGSDEFLLNAFDLFSAAADGSGVPSRLSTGLVLPGGGVLDYLYAPDGTCALFRADSSNGIVHLYSSLVDGSSFPTQLDTVVSAMSDVFAYDVSVDSSRVVYVADETVDKLEIFSVPIDASSLPVKLNPAFVANEDVSLFGISPLGDRVVYTADQDLDNVFEMYSVPIDGGVAPIKLNLAYAGDADVEQLRFTPTGDVLYRADEVATNVFELYSVPSDGSSAPTKISPNLVAGGSILTFALSDDGLTGAYLADQDTNNVFELYTFPTDGSSAPTKVSGIMPATGDVFSFQLGPDGTRVIYTADQETDQRIELWGVPADGSTAPVKLSPTTGTYLAGSAFFSPEGDLVSFGGSEQLGTGKIEFFSVPPDGSEPPAKLNSHLQPDRDVLDGVAIGSGRAVYIANKRDVETDELFVAPADGSTTAKRIEVDLAPAGGDTRGPVISPQSNRVVYRARQETTLFDVYSAILDGTQNSIMVNDPLPFGRFAISFAFTPDGSRILYRADQFVENRLELFATPADGSGSPVLLNQALQPGEQVNSYLVADDDIVFRIGTLGLFAVPPDGSQAPVMLNGPLMPGTFLFGFTLSRGSNRVAYVTTELTSLDELYTAPIDSAGASVRINDPLSGSDSVQSDFAFSPDGAWIVYRIDSAGVQEVYSAPSDGSGSQVKLNASLVPGGSIQDFTISPDSQCVVYRGDQTTDGVQEIFSVPIDGSAAPVQLNVPMPTFADVTALRFSPDGNRVVYRSDHEVNNTDELYSVPATGGATAKLSAIGAASGDVFDAFEVSVGNIVVYLQRLNGIEELFSVPIDGSAAPVRLHQPLVNPFEVLDDFQITPDGSRVVYRAAFLLENPFELWVSEIDGSGEPRRLSVPDPAGGVIRFLVSPDSKKVVFSGRQIIAGDEDLFMSFLAPARKKAPQGPQGSFSRGVSGL